MGETFFAGGVGEGDGVAGDVGVRVLLGRGGEGGVGVGEEVAVRAGPAAKGWEVVAGSVDDGTAEGVVFFACETIGGAGDVVAATPGEAGSAVWLGSVAGEDLTVGVENEGGGPEAVGDVKAGVLVGA